MVTLTKYGAKYNRNILFLEGLSTDTKPTDEFDGLSIQNGSEYTEVDTGKKFLFDYDNATWYEVQTGGGGGGGGFTPTDAQLDAMNSGITSEDVEQISTNKNNILSLKTMGQYTMSGSIEPRSNKAYFDRLFKLALDDLGLSTTAQHHYIVYVYTDTVSPTAELLIMYGTFQYGTSITHYTVHSSQVAYDSDNNLGSLYVSGATAPVKATVRYLD